MIIKDVGAIALISVIYETLQYVLAIGRDRYYGCDCKHNRGSSRHSGLHFN